MKKSIIFVILAIGIYLLSAATLSIYNSFQTDQNKERTLTAPNKIDESSKKEISKEGYHTITTPVNSIELMILGEDNQEISISENPSQEFTTIEGWVGEEVPSVNNQKLRIVIDNNNTNHNLRIVTKNINSIFAEGNQAAYIIADLQGSFKDVFLKGNLTMRIEKSKIEKLSINQKENVKVVLDSCQVNQIFLESENEMMDFIIQRSNIKHFDRVYK